MERHFHEELKRLKGKLLQMGVLVEEAIEKAVRALLERNGSLAEEVFQDETAINQFEIAIDGEGHGLLALGQPMAVDLRLITMMLKINTDLERMGDHAVNIAERTQMLIEEPPLQMNIHLADMAKAAQSMVHDALDSFVNADVDTARNVLKRDDEVDAYNDGLYSQLTTIMEKDPSLTKTGLNLVMVGHNLERIADLANNIAEDVIYLKQGKEVRHRSEESELESNL